MMKHILSLDQGTTSSRAIVFNAAGEAVSVAQREHRQIYPQPGMVEHDAGEIWRNQLAVAIEAMQTASLDASDIAAIGITNQRETVVIWDRATGAPVAPAIVWQDRRTADLCARLKAEGHEALFIERTGLRLDPYFSGTKLRWLLDNVDGLRDRARSGEVIAGTIDSWLLWNLTQGQVHATDASNASRTLLFNIHQGDWDDELLAVLDVPRSLLPRVVDSSGVVGTTAVPEMKDIKIAGIAGDQQAALFGQACFEPGMAKNTYGTGCFLLLQTGERAVPSQNNLLTTVAWRINGRTEYALEGSVFIGGAVIQWLRDEMQLVRSAAECDELAASVEDANGLFLVPAFAGLGAPHWDPYARGAALGMTRGTNRAHFCRAALESVALQSADLIHCMEKDAGIELKELRVDGGASRSALLMQIQSDLLRRDVVRPSCVETTALGAAYLAGLATGVWPDKASIGAHWKVDARFEPRDNAEQMSLLQTGWSKAVARSTGWIS
ncbi:MAG: glycerol kinase GlpK [Verrucomicrobiaceae bacterium]|nr:glycerol kinase GlpK [Verrucomicrobiaceae bacterium]